MLITLAVALILAVMMSVAMANAASLPSLPSPVQDPPPFDWEAELRRIEHEEAVLFAANPLAFWLDPHRYGGKRLEEQRPVMTIDPADGSPLAVTWGRAHAWSTPVLYDNTPSFGGFAEVPGR